MQLDNHALVFAPKLLSLYHHQLLISIPLNVLSVLQAHITSTQSMHFSIRPITNPMNDANFICYTVALSFERLPNIFWVLLIEFSPVALLF